MVATVPHILMTITGGLPAGETWSCGLRSWRTTTPLGSVGGHALALAVANRWADLRNILPPLFGGGGGATVLNATIRELDDNGLTTAQYEAAPTTVMSPAGGNPTLPNQCALVVSLFSARSGRTGKGRFYLPCINIGTSAFSADKIDTTTQTLVATNIGVLLNGINTDLGANPGAGVKLAVQSATAAGNFLDTDGSLANYDGSVITGYKVGNVIDTQRRRRSSVPETYVVGAVA